MVKRLKFLTLNDYYKYFLNAPQNHGATIQQDPTNQEFFFNFSTILPANFFLDKIQVPDVIKMSLPEIVEVNFELIGKGNANGILCAIFIPWIVNVDDVMLDGLESILLYMDDKLFNCLIQQAIFRDKINYNKFKHTEILKDKVIDAYAFFRLNFGAITNQFSSSRLDIYKIQEDSDNDIPKFYEKNWSKLEETKMSKYFIDENNAWFKIVVKGSDQLIGYIRLYSDINVFLIGPQIEYILDREYRGKGYMIETLSALIDYLKKESSALYLFAQTETQNLDSLKLIQKLGFTETKLPYSNQLNFLLSLHNDTQYTLERDYLENKITVTYLNKYRERIHRYL